jgi:hypothetical protein
MCTATEREAPHLLIEVCEDGQAVTSDLVGALATVLLERAKRDVGEIDSLNSGFPPAVDDRT